MRNFYRNKLKRIFDIIVSIFAILILSPVIILTGIFVRIFLGKPIIFKQNRPGFKEKTFELYKFRTMTDTKDAYGNLLEDSIRLTKFGKFLRASSLDELPELFNILKGDMSLVGPRPLLVEYLEYYNEEQKKRHFVRPGLTGLAQVNGRNLLTWEEKFKFDVEYVNNVSFRLDILILLKTIMKVIKKEGISSNSSETMEAFKGSK